MDSDTELNTLRTLVKNMAYHLRSAFNEADFDSEMTEFCSYADAIDDMYETDNTESIVEPDEDEEADGSETIILED
jgi:phosphate uptake regulator